MTPQRRRYHGNRIEQPPTHAQKANLKGQTQLECRAPPIFDQLPLCQRERKEGLDLESGQFPLTCREPITSGAEKVMVSKSR
jgi:hypothetical protein